MNPPYSRTFFDLLLEQAERHPEEDALICSNQIITFGNLADRAKRVGGALSTMGIRRGDRVGILINNRAEWLEIAFGVASVGATSVPFSTWSKQSELDYLLADSGVKALFTLDKFGQQNFAAELKALIPEAIDMPVEAWRSSRYPLLSHLVVIGNTTSKGWTRYEELVNAEPIGLLPPGTAASATDDAFILYTSGSTARPKAVRVMHYAAIENGFNIGERMMLSQTDRVHLAPPLFWSYACINALPAAYTHGAALVLQPQFEAAEAIRLIESYQCTAIYTLPGMTSAIIGDSTFTKERTKSLRTGLTIGSPQDVLAAVEELGVPHLCNIYGGTETYGNCCVTPCDMPLSQRAFCQGPPLPGANVRIVAQVTGAHLGPNEIGEVEVSGYTTPGYCGQSASLNQTAFTPDGFFRMGDTGFLDEQGNFHFTGRVADIIKTGGINVSPAEIEEVLLACDGVEQVAVVGVPDPRKGEAIVAVVVKEIGATITDLDLTQHCRTLMSRYKVPDHIYFCASLPTTDTGKLSRKKVKELAITLPLPDQ